MLRCCTQMRREAETFQPGVRQSKQPGPPLFWNQMAKSAVGCGASENLEPALIQRQCTRTPANSTVAAPHYAYSCRSSGVCRSWPQRAVNCVCAGPSVRRAVRLINKAPAMPMLPPPKLAQKSNPLRYSASKFVPIQFGRRKQALSILYFSSDELKFAFIITKRQLNFGIEAVTINHMIHNQYMINALFN
ncbi:Hypothetical_protein [Hexamita inflata]|uniref:Hypothetical_protein n=1 Tax=Hexamita inflata TaxID=28002 RepID=A0AA86UP30_9EUKA|nr:Hypothetical protein HINF_LOCUS50159 [Hexamita inflata]